LREGTRGHNRVERLGKRPALQRAEAKNAAILDELGLKR